MKVSLNISARTLPAMQPPGQETEKHRTLQTLGGSAQLSLGSRHGLFRDCKDVARAIDLNYLSPRHVKNAKTRNDCASVSVHIFDMSCTNSWLQSVGSSTLHLTEVNDMRVRRQTRKYP